MSILNHTWIQFVAQKNIAQIPCSFFFFLFSHLLFSFFSLIVLYMWLCPWLYNSCLTLKNIISFLNYLASIFFPLANFTCVHNSIKSSKYIKSYVNQKQNKKKNLQIVHNVWIISNYYCYYATSPFLLFNNDDWL